MKLSEKAKNLITFFENSGYPSIAEMVDVLDNETCKSVIYCDPYVLTSFDNETAGVIKGVLSESFVIGSPAGDCSPMDALEMMATEPNNENKLIYVESIACTIAYFIRNGRCLLDNGYVIMI